MSGPRRWKGRAYGFAVGLTVTIATVFAYVAGWLSPLVDWHHDVSFRYFNSVPADPRIVMIDINDHALERIGR